MLEFLHMMVHRAYIIAIPDAQVFWSILHTLVMIAVHMIKVLIASSQQGLFSACMGMQVSVMVTKKASKTRYKVSIQEESDTNLAKNASTLLIQRGKNWRIWLLGLVMCTMKKVTFHVHILHRV